VSINPKGVNQKYSYKERLKSIEINQQNSVKQKMRGHKLRSCIDLQRALKQRGVKQGLGILFQL
jgi:hypothetical protein